MADEVWAYEQNMDGGGNPIPQSYSVFVDSTADETEYVAEVYSEGHAHLVASAPDLYEALDWIRTIADANLEQDDKLRSNGARTLKRIADKCDEALARATGAET